MKLSATTTIRFSQLTPRSIAAVNDLNNIIEKIIGKKLVVISGHTGAIPTNTLFIGFIPDAKNQFQHIDWSFEQNEMVIIACRNNIAVIAGRDKEAVTTTVIGGNGKPINDVQEEYGTVNAIYTFVYEYLGVRFFYDEPGGAYYPDKTEVFKIPNKRIIHAPSIRDRSPMHLLRFKANFPKYAAGRQWALRNRILCNSLNINTSHDFKNYWERYGKDFPQIFALTRGKRAPVHNMFSKIKMCYTQPKLWEIWMDNVAAQLLIDPNQNYFSAAANDGWSDGHCQCENCMALGEYKDQATKEVWFANKLGELLEAKYPGKGYMVGINAYGYSRQPPKTNIKPAANVHVAHVGNFIQRGDSLDGEDQRTQMMAWYKGWSKLTKNLSNRANLGNPVGCKDGAPDFDLHQLFSDFRFLAKNGCNGVWFDALWNYWHTQMPYYYCLAQLCWNPRLKYEETMADFYVKCYGPAMGVMRAYWERIQSIRRTIMQQENAGRHRAAKAANYYTGEVIAELEQYLRMAYQFTTGTKYLDRVIHAQEGFATWLGLLGAQTGASDVPADLE